MRLAAEQIPTLRERLTAMLDAINEIDEHVDDRLELTEIEELDDAEQLENAIDDGLDAIADGAIDLVDLIRPHRLVQRSK